MCFVTTASNFVDKQTTKQLLESLNRVLDEVPPDGNCLFEAVARQINDQSLNHAVLRKLAYEYGKTNAKEFAAFLNPASGEPIYLTLLEQLKEDKQWANDCGDLMPLLISRSIGLDIVILKPGLPPLFCLSSSKSEQKISDDTIVIVYNDDENHYDASKMRKKTAN